MAPSATPELGPLTLPSSRPRWPLESIPASPGPGNRSRLATRTRGTEGIYDPAEFLDTGPRWVAAPVARKKIQFSPSSPWDSGFFLWTCIFVWAQSWVPERAAGKVSWHSSRSCPRPLTWKADMGTSAPFLLSSLPSIRPGVALCLLAFLSLSGLELEVEDPER